MNRKLQLDELGRLTGNQYVDATKNPMVLVADNVRSLSNIGSLFRTSDAFRVMQVVLFGISAVPPHREIHKTALGAELVVPWIKVDSEELLLNHLESLGGSVFCLEQTTGSASLAEMNFRDVSSPIILIAGNEINGVSDFLVERYPSVEIPQFGTKHSFNVSVATGIVLWEIWRQLNKPAVGVG